MNLEFISVLTMKNIEHSQKDFVDRFPWWYTIYANSMGGKFTANRSDFTDELRLQQLPGNFKPGTTAANLKWTYVIPSKDALSQVSYWMARNVKSMDNILYDFYVLDQ